MSKTKYMTKFQLEHLKQRVSNEIDPLIEEAQLLQKSIDQLRNIEKLKMFNPVGEKIGINRKLVEFKSLVENQNIGSLTKYEKNRLRLALTHHDYELPSWIKRA